MRENTVPDGTGGMTWDQRSATLIAEARRLVDHNVAPARHITIDRRKGTIRHSWTGELLHYESGILATALHIRPQEWASA